MIRKLDSREVEQACQVLRSAFATVALEFGLTQENCSTNAAFIDSSKLRDQMQKGLYLYGYFESDELVGVVGVKRLDPKNYTIEKLGVLPSRRHGGVGGGLLKYALGIICNEGARTAHIGIIEGNTVLKNCYQGHGFATTSIKDFPSLPFRVCLMEKAVNDQ
jgi:ribosomal protein S18 acetylase RimI-like enzyme